MECELICKFAADSSKMIPRSSMLRQPQHHADQTTDDKKINYMLLMQQREEENRQEVAKLTAEIKALKLELLELRSKLHFSL